MCGDGEEYKLLINDTYRGWGCGGWGDDAVIYIYMYTLDVCPALWVWHVKWEISHLVLESKTIIISKPPTQPI